MNTTARRRRKRSAGADPARVAELKGKINNEEYLYGAIFRIAQVLSNEIMGIPNAANGGSNDGRKWSALLKAENTASFSSRRSGSGGGRGQASWV